MNFGIRRTLACIGKELTIPASARNISSSTTHSMSSLKVNDDRVIPNSEAMSNIRKNFLGNGSRKAFTVAVEGNIGSGKTTFLNRFCPETDNVDVLAEPVDRWRNVRGNNLLAMMYEDPTRYSLLFQTYVQLTMLERHNQPCDKDAKIMERSLLSARYCFVENLFATGKMSDAEHAVISEWFDYLVSCPQLDIDVDLVVYLRTSPEVAYERILERHRNEEVKVPFEYIRQLHELHEEWLFTRTKFQTPSKIIVIDANGNLESLQAVYDEKKKTILEMAKEANLKATRFD